MSDPVSDSKDKTLPRQTVVLKTWVVMTKPHAANILMQTTNLQRQLVRAKRRLHASEEKRSEERTLLVLALHELAIERKSKDPQHFVRKWIVAHAKERFDDR
jgi:hypothetical protein